jgi:acyl dehydratase
MTPLSYADYAIAQGRDLGASPWFPVEQARIDAFASCTEDAQWIHVDAERAAGGPFGTTIAHGYLTLSLLIPMIRALGGFPEDGTTVVNYGLDRLRFLAPVPSGSRVCGRVTVGEVRPKGDGRLLVPLSCRVEIEGEQTPALLAEVLLLLLAPA